MRADTGPPDPGNATGAPAEGAGKATGSEIGERVDHTVTLRSPQQAPPGLDARHHRIIALHWFGIVAEDAAA